MYGPLLNPTRLRPAGALSIALEARPHPQPHSLAAAWQVWGSFRLTFAAGGQPEVLYAFDWDLAPLAAWLVRRPGALWQEALSVGGDGPQPGESLAQAVARLGNRAFADEAAAYEDVDAFWHYVDAHNLRRAFPGTTLPDLFIGCNHGAGEISVWEAGQGWARAFDMQPFIAGLCAAVLAILEPVAGAASPTPARAAALVAAVRAYPLGGCGS